MSTCFGWAGQTQYFESVNAHLAGFERVDMKAKACETTSVQDSEIFYWQQFNKDFSVGSIPQSENSRVSNARILAPWTSLRS